MNAVTAKNITTDADRWANVEHYELSNGQHAKFDRRAVQEYGLARLLADCSGLTLDTVAQLEVWRSGRHVGYLPASFDPRTARSLSVMYDVRDGDFTRNGDRWIASPSLGDGDLEAIGSYRAKRRTTKHSAKEE